MSLTSTSFQARKRVSVAVGAVANSNRLLPGEAGERAAASSISLRLSLSQIAGRSGVREVKDLPPAPESSPSDCRAGWNSRPGRSAAAGLRREKQRATW